MELTAIGRELEKLERPKAQERKSQKPGGKRGEKVSSENFTGETATTRDKVGEALGVSGATCWSSNEEC